MDFAIGSRIVEGGLAIIVHRVNGSACLEQQVRDGKIPFVSRLVEGVPAKALAGTVRSKSRGNGGAKRRELLEERKGKPQLFWEPERRIS